MLGGAGGGACTEGWLFPTGRMGEAGAGPMSPGANCICRTKIHVYKYPAMKYALKSMVWEKPMVEEVQLT